MIFLRGEPFVGRGTELGCIQLVGTDVSLLRIPTAAVPYRGADPVENGEEVLLGRVIENLLSAKRSVAKGLYRTWISTVLCGPAVAHAGPSGVNSRQFGRLVWS